MNGVIYTCSYCGRQERRAPVPAAAGGDDASARAVGWRIGVHPEQGRVVVCPECSGADEQYWDRRTLGIAYAAGIDAGNPPWGGV